MSVSQFTNTLNVKSSLIKLIAIKLGVKAESILEIREWSYVWWVRVENRRPTLVGYKQLTTVLAQLIPAAVPPAPVKKSIKVAPQQATIQDLDLITVERLLRTYYYRTSDSLKKIGFGTSMIALAKHLVMQAQRNGVSLDHLKLGDEFPDIFRDKIPGYWVAVNKAGYNTRQKATLDEVIVIYNLHMNGRLHIRKMGVKAC